jgi:hypothetical protein
MDQPRELTIDETWADTDHISAALRRAGRAALLMHARAGNPVSTWKDGKVVWLQPEEVFALVKEQEEQETNGFNGATKTPPTAEPKS